MIKTCLIPFLPVSLILSGCGGATTGTPANFTSWASITHPSVVTASAVAYEGTYNYDTTTANLTSVGAASTASSPEVSLTYNSSGTITAASISTSSQTQIYDEFRDANSSGTLFYALKSSDNSDWAMVAQPTNSALNWKYNSMAAWTDADGSGSGKYGSISAGSQTAGSGIPTSSSATFSGAGSGFYTDASNNVYVASSAITANANFATQQVTLSSNNTVKNQFDASTGAFATTVTDSNLNFTGTLSHSTGTNDLSGTLTTTSGMSGPSQSVYYGPNSEEIGGVFNITGSSQTYVGAFGAKQ
jgi:hypothetical protein